MKIYSQIITKIFTLICTKRDYNRETVKWICFLERSEIRKMFLIPNIVFQYRPRISLKLKHRILKSRINLAKKSFKGSLTPIYFLQIRINFNFKESQRLNNNLYSFPSINRRLKVSKDTKNFLKMLWKILLTSRLKGPL